jgi:hypothetical protein
MTKPEVRSELLEIAQFLDEQGHALVAHRIRQLVVELHNRKPVHRTAPRRRSPGRSVIQAYASANPGLDYCAIGQALGVNQGRVSEALAGKRP